MKISLKKYNSDWPIQFEKQKEELLSYIGFLNPKIEHIGSTSIKGLSAKPIIDILVGLEKETDLDKVIQPLTTNNYIYYPIYNKEMPYRRFFVKHKVSPQILNVPTIIDTEEKIPKTTEEHNQRLAHIHILPQKSEHWTRHIAFRNYLRVSPQIKNQYQELKQYLSEKKWEDGNDYSQAKNEFIKREEANAIKWFLKQLD